jgi:predicted dehydrogenase
MIKTAIIGLGKMGISHCAIANANPKVELTAVCDTSTLVRQVFKRFSKFNIYSDYKKMLDEEQIDSVIIATPTKFHHSIVMESLSRNLHVFCEKPFSLNPDQSLEMVEEVEKRKLVNQVGFHNRSIGTFIELKRLLEAGIIGDLYHFSGEAYGPVVVREKTDTWRSKRSEGGGCLYDYASHVIDLIHFTLGKTRSVSGTMLKNTFSREVEDTVYSSILLENGKSGQLAVNWSDETYRKMSTSITVWGKKGKMICDATELKIYLKEENPAYKLEKGWTIRYITDLAENVDFYLRGEEYSAQLSSFFNAIERNETETISSFRNALQTDIVISSLIKDSKSV